MQALILAGGEGRRLHADGISIPKALVPVAGYPLLGRLSDILSGLGYHPVTAAVRTSALAHPAWRTPLASGLRIVPCTTPSSLHTLDVALRAMPPGPLLCTMVDAVMRSEDWYRVGTEAVERLRGGADACVAVTPFVDDEAPLYVSQRLDGSVSRFGKEPLPPLLVTGGIYVLSSRVRSMVPKVLGLGVVRMRGFLAWLVEHGYRVETSRVERIVDLDRGRDLVLAESWLGGSQ